MSGNNTFIIGEIGQNHNGSVDLAKQIINLACRPIKEKTFNLNLKPMDAVKLVKRDLNQELSRTQKRAPYLNEHSFGDTYGEHRAFLELSNEDHFELYKYAKAKGMAFIETLCAPGCLDLLKWFTPDYLKVASRDLTNIPLISRLAETKIPMIISTGMAGKKELDEAIETITKQHSNLSILHCVSQYPTEPQNVNLNTIRYLKDHYSDFKIGFSDHTIGIAAPVAAIAMGAEIIEKHITLDRNMKGRDQKGSLGPEGVYRMVRDIRVLERSFGEEDIFISESTAPTRIRLERSIASKKALKKGEKITLGDIHLLSPGDGFKWAERDNVVGKKLKADMEKDEIIYPNAICDETT